METLIQLNLNERLEMPEPSEAAAQGVGKQELSRVPVELGAPPLSLWNMVGQHTRGLFVPSLPKAPSGSPWAVPQLTRATATQPRAAGCHLMSCPAPGAVVPLSLPSQTKGTSGALCRGPERGQTGPIILIKEIKPCIDFSPGWRRAGAVKALHNPFTRHRATLPSL